MIANVAVYFDDLLLSYSDVEVIDSSSINTPEVQDYFNTNFGPGNWNRIEILSTK